MKGFTHFISGVAIASCFPEAVIAASTGNPLYFVLGGFGGILPDTVDFKFVRFLYRVDIEVQPDPSGFDAQMVADGIGLAIREASVRNRPVRLKLNTVRVGADAWQQYSVDLDVVGREIRVQEGPIVNTGQQAIRPPRGESVGRVKVEPEIRLDYEALVMVDIFDGPIFQMTPDRGGRVICPEFIPWHRKWTHSLVVAAGVGGGVAMIWGPLAGVVTACGYAIHVLEDQMGYMGASLCWPLSRRRSHGMGLMHAMDVFPNVFTVWLSILLIIWNLYMWTPGVMVEWNAIQILVLGVGLPLAVRAGTRWWRRQKLETD